MDNQLIQLQFRAELYTDGSHQARHQNTQHWIQKVISQNLRRLAAGVLQ